MISPESISKQWISEISTSNRADQSLVQKLIRALMLLEGLCESNLNFIFKGGTALMLLLNSTKRLSIDIDIIIPKKEENINDILYELAINKGFTRVEEKKRHVNSDIEKAHYKFHFPCSLKLGSEEFVLLDILFERNHYNNVVQTPINSAFVIQDGEPLNVVTPDFNNIMGDKLTAFAPNTTGIPYFKKEKPMGQEIIKQLYDVGNIFEHLDDLSIVTTVFSEFAKIELAYRKLGDKQELVLDDIVETCLSITLREQIGNSNIEVLQLGLKQIRNYIFSETYHIEKAITHAARTAYLAGLIKKGGNIEFYSKAMDMREWQIQLPNNTKLNKLKKTNPEAFYYWYSYYLD